MQLFKKKKKNNPCSHLLHPRILVLIGIENSTNSLGALILLVRKKLRDIYGERHFLNYKTESNGAKRQASSVLQSHRPQQAVTALCGLSTHFMFSFN